MKKLLIALALASVSMSGFAQDDATPTQKYSVATNSFWSNWFVEAGADWNVWYSGEEHGYGLAKSPFKKFRTNPGASLAVGKWFTPGLGLRTKLQGIWGKKVDADWDDGTNKGNGNKYWILNEHILFNVSNMLFGYNPNRVWNVIPFLGGGVARTCTYNMYAMDLSAGIQSTWKLSKHFNVYVEAGWNRLEGDIDGGPGYTDGHRGWDSHDNNVYAEVGVHVNLGKSTWEKVPDVDALNALHQSQLDALKNQLDDANAENDRLKNLLANQKPAETPAAVKELVNTPVSVFFNLDKTNIASQKDLVNVQAIAKYAKENGARLIVNGYADSATGKPDHNQWLSDERAKTVAKEIQKMGVDASKITTKGNGGVDELSPISFNRRATVQIAE